MKAVVYTEYGPPEVAQLKEVEKPVPKDDEVLVRVHASTVNRTDCGFRSANYFIVRFFAGLFRPKNQILGCEFAGEVEAVGKDARRFLPGDRVFGYDDQKFGGHAEYIVLKPGSAVAHIPEGFSYEEAAPLTEGTHYALCNIRAAKVKPGDHVLVNGGTGAIGSAGIQLLKHFGATVTATCRTEHLELVRSLGADRVIDYTKEDFTRLSDRFDFIFDAVGKSTFGRCKPLLKPKGIYISTELGPGMQNPLLALTTPLFGQKKLLFPIPVIKQEDVDFLKELASRGEFRPLIDRTYSLEQIQDAFRYVETGQKVGNVVLTI